ncbi:MAG: YbdD/YjiX family protein [Gammaproteobacteria bacterium]|nr:YbdD/YjiX family protein [Gammaproteobacteria bacterium]
MCRAGWSRHGPVTELLRRCWSALRRLSGDDAYERYLAHWHEHHGDRGAPVDRAAFFRGEQARKWDGVRRCC